LTPPYFEVSKSGLKAFSEIDSLHRSVINWNGIVEKDHDFIAGKTLHGTVKLTNELAENLMKY
jgi:hypothetical protein